MPPTEPSQPENDPDVEPSDVEPSDVEPTAVQPTAVEPTDRVGQLRGAGVSVDGRRVGQVAIGIVLVTLLVLTIVFTLVGIHTNQQNDRLHNDGVPVTFTVTGCLGLLGGSGSNAAGYSCHGTYSLDGKTYSEQLPGDSLHRPGSTVPSVAVPGDPALVSPASIVATEHSSAGVFVLPIIFFVVLLVLVALLVVLRRRRQGSASGDAQPAH
jgi:hypothetical protein